MYVGVLPFKEPMKPNIEREQRYYDALKRIASYESAQSMRKNAWKDWGLEDDVEALEYAYENMQQEARLAIKGRKRPSR